MAKQATIPLSDLAVAMRSRSIGFARRVARFESQFGPADDATLATLAQAAYFCWFECEYEADFLGVCQAIGLGRSTSLLLCAQITPARWNAIHAYVVAVQRWRGMDCALPRLVNDVKVQKIYDWLGPRNPSKEALADLFLHWLVVDLRRHSISRLAGPGEPEERAEYEDYSQWHRRLDGGAYSEDVAATAARCRQLLTDLEQVPADDSEALVAGITAQSQPACQHRYSRYQDIKLASIGAMRWRGAVPPDDEVPKQEVARFLDAAAVAVRDWADHRLPETDLARRIHQSLGPITDKKRFIALNFFLLPKDDLGDSFYYWLDEQADQRRCLAACAFQGT